MIKKAFSLVEILIIITIVSILGSFAVNSVLYTEKSLSLGNLGEEIEMSYRSCQSQILQNKLFSCKFEYDNSSPVLHKSKYFLIFGNYNYVDYVNFSFLETYIELENISSQNLHIEIYTNSVLSSETILRSNEKINFDKNSKIILKTQGAEFFVQNLFVDKYEIFLSENEDLLGSSFNKFKIELEKGNKKVFGNTFVTPLPNKDYFIGIYEESVQTPKIIKIKK